MRIWTLGAVLVLSLAIARVAMSQVPADHPPTLDVPSRGGEATAEPITGEAAQPVPDPYTVPPRDPFTPFETGEPANDTNATRELNVEQRAAIAATRGRSDVQQRQKVQDAYGEAVAERTHIAAGASAANQLNAGNLAVEGVVP